MITVNTVLAAVSAMLLHRLRMIFLNVSARLFLPRRALDTASTLTTLIVGTEEDQILVVQCALWDISGELMVQWCSAINSPLKSRLTWPFCVTNRKPQAGYWMLLVSISLSDQDFKVKILLKSKQICQKTVQNRASYKWTNYIRSNDRMVSIPNSNDN